MAEALTGIPAFDPTTARFKTSPRAIAPIAGIRRFRTRKARSERYDAIRTAAPDPRVESPGMLGTGAACSASPTTARPHQ
jgi:hypothetical protein